MDLRGSLTLDLTKPPMHFLMAQTTDILDRFDSLRTATDYPSFFEIAAFRRYAVGVDSEIKGHLDCTHSPEPVLRTNINEDVAAFSRAETSAHLRLCGNHHLLSSGADHMDSHDEFGDAE